MWMVSKAHCGVLGRKRLEVVSDLCHHCLVKGRVDPHPPVALGQGHDPDRKRDPPGDRWQRRAPARGAL